MTMQEQLYPLARRAFWGYFFVLLNINFTFNNVFALQLLPNTVGWWLLARVCREGKELRPSLGLLHPFCLVLAVWNVQQFFPTLDARMPAVLTLLAGVVTLYFYFQFLTDLSALAEEVLPDDPRPQALLGARNVLVAVYIFLFCYDLLLRLPMLAIVLLLVSLCVNIYILVKLWGLSRALAPEEEQPPQAPSL